jgi:DNA polymerase-1
MAASTESQILLCVDFANLVIRHHANKYSTDVDMAGRRIAGACGALRQVISLVEREQPTHLLIARDGPRANTARRALYHGYKAHRSDPDDEVLLQFRLVDKALKILGWPFLALEGHEADDVIASAAASFAGQTVIVTGDKDLLALCAPKVTVCLLRSGGAYERAQTAADCRRLMGVDPDQVRDLKALAGDSSDGIPGIKGVGEKTAQSLLGRYRSLEGIYAQVQSEGGLEGIRPHIAAKVAEGREAAELSWQLAGLESDLAVDFDDLVCHELDHPIDHSDELRDAGLGQLLKTNAQPAPSKTDGLSMEEIFSQL